MNALSGITFGKLLRGDAVAAEKEINNLLSGKGGLKSNTVSEVEVHTGWSREGPT